MSTKIFVNLPVKDLDRAKDFYTKAGWEINPDFSDENAATVVISEDIYVMLLTEEFFQQNIGDKKMADPATTSEAEFALSTDSRQDVDDRLAKVLAAGGRESGETMNWFRSPARNPPSRTPVGKAGVRPRQNQPHVQENRFSALYAPEVHRSLGLPRKGRVLHPGDHPGGAASRSRSVAVPSVSSARSAGCSK